MNGPDVLRLAELRNTALGLIDAGRKPDPRELRMVVSAVHGDKSHPYWNSASPSHHDATQLVTDLIGLALHAEGVDISAEPGEYVRD